MQGNNLTIRSALLIAIVLGMSCAPEEPPPEAGFTVRLLTSVALSGRWEREAERGLGLIAAELEADIGRTRAQGAADQRRRLREHAAEGVDLVFCVGPDVEALVYTDAPAFPDTDFVIIPGEIHAANVGSVVFMPEEAGFLAGAVAASVASSPKLGLLRGAGRPWLERLESGFETGFRTIHPDADLVTARGLDGPWELAAEGVEVALYSTDRSDPGLLAAAHDSGLLLVGADPGLLHAEPDLAIAAVELDVAEAMLRVAREVLEHRFVGKVYAFDLGSGVLDVRLNPAFETDSRSRAAREALEVARSEITAGWVEIEGLGIGK